MKIDSSSVVLAAKSEYTEVNIKNTSFQAWGLSGTGAKKVEQAEESREVPAAVLELTEKGAQQLEDAQKKAFSTSSLSKTSGTGMDVSSLFSEKEQIQMDMLIKLIERLTGKRLNLKLPGMSMSFDSPDVQFPEGGGQGSFGWGVSYQSSEYYSEQESMEFSAVGNVTTADGRTVQFDMTVGMSREFVRQNSVDIRMGDAQLCDPLVINYQADSVSLTDEKFRFDLDCDGTEDQISRLGNGSGFLALDINQDGKINDGGELFGAKSGDGFADLAKYDGDGNGWIDENDDIFRQLRIWSTDAQGNSRLYGLAEKGVGAIYLGNINSNYKLTGNDADNTTNGMIRKSGVFLHENGSAGTIQHVDLAI